MLTFLRIKNLAIVKDLSLDFGPGLTLITGETGAGKSILVEALGVALGERAGRDLVRSGEEKAEVEARFEIGEGRAGPVRELLESVGAAIEEGEVLARREIGEAARSRQFLNDVPVTLATLRRFGRLVIEIQGQHEHLALLAGEAQRDAIDRFGGLEAARASVAEAAEAANGALEGVAELGRRLQDPRGQIDYLEYQVRELEALAPREGEEAELRAERALAQHAARRRELAEGAFQELYEEDGSALGRLTAALGAVTRLASIDGSCESHAVRLELARQALEEVALELRDYRDVAEADPARLEAIEHRLAAYDRMARRLGCGPDELPAALSRVRDEARALASGEETLEAAKREAERLRREYLERAEALSALRKGAGERLSGQLARELAELAMEASEVHFAIEAVRPPPDALPRREGIDRVELLLATNAGEPARPLRSIASGGELSRVMLALNTVLGRGRRRRALVFDEVDAGIGGSVAAVVADKLKALAGAHQVVVVTHLAAIASRADRHYAVEKRARGGRSTVAVRELDRAGRVAELARMMGGQSEAPALRRHAESMLRKSAARAERRSP